MKKTYIIIYKTYTVTEGNHPINYHVLYNVSRGELFFNECATKFLDITPSTPFDIAKLTDALLKEGKRWNPETKQVEDVEKKPEHVFKPFDKVLVKDSDTDIWICDIFSHMDDDNAFYCVRGIWNYCIPYEGNEHLVGKTGNSEEHEDVDDIMKLVDNYTVEPGMIPDSRFSIHSDNNCKYPVCPCCGSLKYTIVSHPNGNHRCDRCGRVYFFNYNQSI